MSCLSNPDILLGSLCQLWNEKWLCSSVCFHSNPSRKELVFSSPVLLKLALASCRIPGLTRASRSGKSCRDCGDKLDVRAKCPKEHVQEQHREQEVLQHGREIILLRIKLPKKVFLGSQEGLNHGTRFGTAAGCWSGHWDWNQDDSFRSLTKLSNYAFLGGKKEKNGMFDSVSAEHSTIAVFNKYSGGS